MAAARRRRRTGPPRCNTCGALVVFFRLPSGELAPFRPNPIPHYTQTGGRVYPIFGGRAWVLDELVDDLQARAQQSRQDALDEAYALPWHTIHHCIPTGDEDR